ncbi:MAG: hypothetical protein P0Y49_10865 [Candidatus Pedobacter colombiensis]|uniref:Uncharacterized protein n=1 Tax=Candidatus Pedobacter colombiensis TaxID=3121371 RepID=A0AAJ5WBQ1_9SPHI|nr:hypothetical protein [Pedobacter sp.]WEK21637.1 MAG: hypothetical protein P0Y49_10865 [Pedobacter sp.]
MKNLDNMEYTDAQTKKMGYITICLVMKQVIVYGKKIALYGELKDMRKLVNPFNFELDEDMDLLQILDEPHVKLASRLAAYIRCEVLDRYALLNALNDEIAMEDEWATKMAWKMARRYLLYSSSQRRRDRYFNFGKILLNAQRAIYEMMKLMVTGKTRVFNSSYRCNYSPGRLKALMIGIEDQNVLVMLDLIEKLKDCEAQSCAIRVKI